MKTSADEMGYGLTVLWLAVTVMFFAVAAMWNGHGGIGYFLLALGVLGLLRSARHMREGFEIAKAEDAEREAQWRRWAEEIGSRKSELGTRNDEKKYYNSKGFLQGTAFFNPKVSSSFDSYIAEKASFSDSLKGLCITTNFNENSDNQEGGAR